MKVPVAILSAIFCSTAMAMLLATPVAQEVDATSSASSCTTTMILPWAGFDMSQIKTVYADVVTEINEVDCGACSDVAVMHHFLGIGPVVHITGTTMLPVTTTTTTVCAPTDV
ncbi:hypothetical protein MMC13_003225 [Lambiella insularis]|nr:hypothetical protein [Lambiella insularis]